MHVSGITDLANIENVSRMQDTMLCNFYRYISNLNVSDIVKDEDETPLEMVWPNVKANVKVLVE